MGMVGNEGRGNRRRNNKQETGCTFRVEYGRVRSTAGDGKSRVVMQERGPMYVLRLRRRRDKMGRTRGMFLRLINGKVEMLRARFKLAYIYIHICIYVHIYVVYKAIICLLYVMF